VILFCVKLLKKDSVRSNPSFVLVPSVKIVLRLNWLNETELSNKMPMLSLPPPTALPFTIIVLFSKVDEKTVFRSIPMLNIFPIDRMLLLATKLGKALTRMPLLSVSLPSVPAEMISLPIITLLFELVRSVMPKFCNVPLVETLFSVMLLLFELDSR